MKTTHVGSLPFLDVNQAMDYTFKWDIPVLFTLPKLDPNQLMGKHLNSLLDFEKYALSSTKEIEPHYLHDFVQMLKLRQVTKFKYQLTGPITFYELLDNKADIDFLKLAKFLEAKYLSLVERLAFFGEVLFVLDEPMLDKNYDFYSSVEGLGLLNKLSEHAEVFIHSCAALNLEHTQKYTHYLNIDMNLYDEKDEKLSEIIFPGGGSLAHAKYISPSCGLALKTVDEVTGILEDIKRSIP